MKKLFKSQSIKTALSCWVLLGIMSISLQAQSYIRIKNRWQKDGKTEYKINIQNATVDAGATDANWWSAQWVMEKVSGSNFYRFKNRWQKDGKSNYYLHNQTGKIEAGPIQSGWWSAQWSLEPVTGTKFYRIKNRWKTDQYLHIQNPTLSAGKADPNWWSAQWELEGFTGTVASTPTPPVASPGTTFLFISDPQITDDNRDNKDDFEKKMRAFVKIVNGLDKNTWPGETAPIKPTFMVMGGDLTQWGGGWSTGVNVAGWADSDWDRGDKFVHFTKYFDRNRSDEAIDLPMYVGMGNHDLNHQHGNLLYPDALNRRMVKYVRTKHQGSNAEVKVGSFDDASGSFSWVIDGVHFIQFHRFGGDNITNLRQDNQTRPNEFYLTDNYQESNNSLSWIRSDLLKHKNEPTLVFQHYDWHSPAKESGTSYYAWWTPAEMNALDATLVESQKKIIRFHGHSHQQTKYMYTDKEGNQHQVFDGGAANPSKGASQKITFLVVRISPDKKSINVLESYVDVTNTNNTRLELGRKSTVSLQLSSPLKENNCNCAPKTFRSVSDHTWVEFRLPKGNLNQSINIGGGAYNKYVFPKCNRVHWTDLKFTCDPNSCTWKKTSGSWDADALCHGSKGSSPYVFVGNR